MAESEAGLTVVIDRETCMGLGVCVHLAPATFTQDADTKAVLLDPPGDPVDDIESAVEGCPSGALSLVPTTATTTLTEHD